MARPGHWLVKTEPETYSWQDFLREGGTLWDGVRSFQARNHLQAMEKGDLVLFYHSVKPREVVGVARVTRPAYPDPTTDDERWVAVDLEPVEALPRPVSLAEIRKDAALAEIALVRQSRLSVMPLGAAEFRRILTLGKMSARPGAT